MLACPRCHRANPDEAAFCHFDGVLLRGSTLEAPPTHRFPREWELPGGRRCGSLDELARGFLADWDAAREALADGSLLSFLRSAGLADLARAALDAQLQPDPDVGLQTFLERVPTAVSAAPALDLQPRRLLLTDVTRGQLRLEELRLFNRGRGLLHGTVRVVEGGNWIALGEGLTPGPDVPLKTRTEQTVFVQIDPFPLPTAGSYVGKLLVQTNGGTLEIPVQADLVVQPVSFRGMQVGTERDLAKLMKERPKEAVGWLEDGSVAKWFEEQGWPFPVEEPIAPGMAGVQQFFEALRLSRPPAVELSASEMSLVCQFPEAVECSVTLFTADRKWVYARVESDSYWLVPREEQVAGPQKAEIAFDVDSSLLEAGHSYEGNLSATANGGQTLGLRVLVEVRRGFEPFTRRLLRPFLSG